MNCVCLNGSGWLIWLIYIEIMLVLNFGFKEMNLGYGLLWSLFFWVY